MLPLALIVLRRRVPITCDGARTDRTARGTLGLSPNALTALLSVAAIGCCVAMATPQVQIVAYCGDLGYGAARGAEMLSVMLALGVVSRVAGGMVRGPDRRARRRCCSGRGCRRWRFSCSPRSTASPRSTWCPGCSACFRAASCRCTRSSCANISRSQEAGIRAGTMIGISVVGMALGGWASGAIDRSHRLLCGAFLHGFLWNLLNAAIVVWLLMRSGWGLARRLAPA